MPKLSHIALLVACLLTLVAAAVQARDRVARMVTEAEAPIYRAVGRLNVAGNRHCTATLIGEQLVLTAAHCLYNPLTGRRAAPKDLRFVAGQRGETHAALRGVSGAVTLPGYRFRRLPDRAVPANDVALLLLDAPIAAQEAGPLPPGDWKHGRPVLMVSFGRDRAYIASVQEDCRSMQRSKGLVLLDCPVVPGMSGAPMLQAGPEGLVVVGVVSSALRQDAAAVTVQVTPRMIDTLKIALLGTAI